MRANCVKKGKRKEGRKDCKRTPGFSLCSPRYLCVLCGYLIAILITMQSCRSRKQPVAAPAQPDTILSSCSSVDNLLQAVSRADVDFRWFTAKVSAYTDINRQANSFTANLRIKRDSAIWMSITPALGIEVARVFITPDSVRFINRINGTYFKGDYRYLKSLLQTEVNFRMIQAVLLGNSYLHYTVDNYSCDSENADCILSTFKKRRIRRENDLVLPEVLTQEVWYSPEKQKITRMEMQDFRPVRKFTVAYTAFEPAGEWLFPKALWVHAHADKQARIDLEYSKITVDREVNLPFSIPDSYEPMR